MSSCPPRSAAGRKGSVFCNTQEISSDGGCSTGGEHQVDNHGESNYEFDAVLFLFSSPVNLSSIRVVTTDDDDLDAEWRAAGLPERAWTTWPWVS